MFNIGKFIRSVIDLGTRDQPLEDQPGTRLINGTALLGVFVVLEVLIMMIVASGFNLMVLLVSGFYVSLFSSLIYLNYLKKWVWSNRLYISSTFLMVCSLHFYAPYQSSWIFFVCIFAFYAAILKTKAAVIGYSVLLLGLILVSQKLQHSPSYAPIVEYSEHDMVGLYLINFLSSIACVVFIVFYVKSNLIRHQRELEKLLAERSLLVKEVHHRVKNNLQVVSSLFSLQERKIPEQNKEALKMIHSGQGRVQSMALVHQELYDSPDLQTIELNSYIQNLTFLLTSIYDDGEVLPTVECDIANLSLPLETVIPIGLILNEAMTNSIKYAFPSNVPGRIRVTYGLNDDTHVFTIEDNGQGYEQKNSKKSTGIGNQLIADMANQLHARYELQTDNGVRHRIIFKPEEYAS